MISQREIAKALRDKLSTATSLPIATEGAAFTPSPSVDYVREFVLYGNEREVSLSGTGSKDQQGIYQIDVCTRVSGGKFGNLAVCDTIKPHFAQSALPGGLVLLDVSSIGIRNDVSSSGIRNDGTHLVTSLRVRWRVVKI